MMELCSIQGCDNKIQNKLRKLCSRHYSQWLNQNTRKRCKVKNCNTHTSTKGYCQKHYNRIKKYGDPLPDQKFIFKVPSGYRVNNQGYAEIRLEEKENNRSTWVKEHRYLMELKLGRKLKKNEQIHHKDGNKLNNNIDNLELWITRQQPSGQRVEDMLAWAYYILEEYKNYEM